MPSLSVKWLPTAMDPPGSTPIPVSLMLVATISTAWMEQECEGHADAVFAAEHRGELAGYLSCAVDDIAHRGTIGLVGVSESHRRLGIGSLLLTEALSWFHEQGVPVVSVVTQGRNTSALRLYQRHGFEIDEVGLWFHKW